MGYFCGIPFGRMTGPGPKMRIPPCPPGTFILLLVDDKYVTVEREGLTMQSMKYFICYTLKFSFYVANDIVECNHAWCAIDGEDEKCERWQLHFDFVLGDREWRNTRDFERYKDAHEKKGLGKEINLVSTIKLLSTLLGVWSEGR